MNCVTPEVAHRIIRTKFGIVSKNGSLSCKKSDRSLPDLLIYSPASKRPKLTKRFKSLPGYSGVNTGARNSLTSENNKEVAQTTSSPLIIF
jgi:hypothetical protein